MNMLSAIAQPATLDAWLAHIESLNARPINMGLERVGRVWRALGATPTFAIVTVGGTNGKGSTCTFLESILGSAGYSVGTYTSPHFLRHNERVRVDGEAAADEALCEAFASIERARGDIPLSYFEFGTLAAMLLFVDSDVDVAILEVGLGGRLDAVNIFDPQCTVVTSVDMDHMDYLGQTREAIGYEKAGIFRRAIAAVCADPDPPASVSRHARTVDARLLRIGQDFGYSRSGEGWGYWGPGGD
ncbi:MAG: Mur ligase family protein, partial [Sulfuritalea sp.]|nr:Mur ligase family protein [Sulfuritalea sp.]